jgi:peptide/nickel transport system permease protein
MASQETPLASLVSRPSRWSASVHGTRGFIKKKPLGSVGALIVLLMAFAAATAPIIVPYDPFAIDPLASLEGPSWSHPLGTDPLGRDMLSRIIYGSQASLYVGLMVITFGTGTATVLGMVSGYFMGRFDLLFQRVMDSLMAFPFLVLVLAMVAALGPSIHNVIIALSIVLVPGVARVVRGATLSTKENTYVDAARAIGAGHVRVIFRHIFPNVVASVIVLASIQLGTVIIVEASLSFLGLGTPPPTPTWGGMLSGTGRQYFELAPWLAVFPGLAISLAVLGFNLFGDALRDVLDPRLRGT